MAYLTKYTFRKLCRKADIKEELNLDFFLKRVYNDSNIYFMFNKLEIKYLFNFRNILEDAENYFIEYYKEVPERVDNKNFVFEKGGKLKYHLTDECSFLKKDFIDFHIPPEIKELGDNVIEEYRNWFKTKGYAELFHQNKLDPGMVVFAYNLKFPNKYDIKKLNENYKLVEKIPNSNNRILEKEFNHERFKTSIEHLKEKFKNIFSCKISRIMSKYDYLLCKSNEEITNKMTELFSENFTRNYGLENIKEKLTVSKEIKSKLLEELIEYFKWTYKFNGKYFNNLTLEKFGLKCCGNCCKNK